MLLSVGRLVSSTATLAPGWVEVADGKILALGAGPPPRPADHEFPELTLVPSFVDMHVHGGGGAGYSDGSREHALAARAAHRAHGTTRTLASLVTADAATLLAQVALLADLAESGDIGGIHLEGPWLSPHRAGAHDKALLRPPHTEEIAALLRAGRGQIRMVTLAPELPGALAAITQLVDAGVVVAIGHTEADFDTTRRAIAAGARVATHLFNAMPGLHHRSPGPALALLEDPRVTLELIADGTHLHPEFAAWITGRAGAGRIALVTDAMGAAACGDGNYRLGALDVEVRAGQARLAGTDTIAGSTVTMDVLFRAAAGVGVGGGVEAVGGVGAAGDAGAAGDVGAAGDTALMSAVQMTATTPARALGWHDTGDLAPGLRADFVLLDAQLRVAEVWLGGTPLSSHPDS